MRSARQALREFLGWGNAAPPHGALERTQPQRDFMYGVGELRRSARGRWAATNTLRTRNSHPCHRLSPRP